MRIVVDLNRCQAYAQCCFLASSVFQLHGEEALFYDPAPDVVSTYREIEALLHDPRVSHDMRNSAQTGGRPRTSTDPYEFLNLDPPEHDRLRQLAMRHFGPPERPDYLEQLCPEIARIVTALLDQLRGQPPNFASIAPLLDNPPLTNYKNRQ